MRTIRCQLRRFQSRPRHRCQPRPRARRSAVRALWTTATPTSPRSCCPRRRARRWLARVSAHPAAPSEDRMHSPPLPQRGTSTHQHANAMRLSSLRILRSSVVIICGIVLTRALQNQATWKSAGVAREDLRVRVRQAVREAARRTAPDQGAQGCRAPQPSSSADCVTRSPDR